MGFAENFQAASFRGVSFLVNTETVERGKKVVLHEYPNSDVRFAEELGKIPPTFRIEAIIHGEDVISQRLRLENALEASGQEKLVHPVYGELDVMVLDFSVTSNQTSFGEIRFSINFAQSRLNVSPAPTVTSETAVTKAAEDARTELDADLEDKFEVPDTVQNFTAITDKATELWESTQDSINAVVDLVSEKAATFNRVVRTSVNNVFSIVQSAADLKDSVSLIIDTALDTARSPEQLLAAWTSLLSTPLFPIGNTNTLQQTQKERNNALLSEHMRLTALANTYEATIYTNFNTDVELEAAKSFLDDNYIEYLFRVIDDLKEDNVISITGTQAVRIAFANLRNIAQKVFDEKEKAVFRIVNITPGNTSMALTAYRYYGNLDFIDFLTTLNLNVNNANFNEEIKALSQ